MPRGIGAGLHAAKTRARDFFAIMCIDTHLKSGDIIRAIEADGWVLVRITGSHHHFRHGTKPGTVTIPHPVKDIPIGTLKSIERQSGLKIRT